MVLASLALAVAFQGPAIDFGKTWQNVRSSIESRYYARTSQKDRMKALLDKYEPAAKATKDKAEFEKDVNDMIADFGDSHFGFFTKSSQGYYVMEGLTRRSDASQMPNIGAWFRPEGKYWAIQMLLNGGPPRRPACAKAT